jgi:hypothetical protein
MAEFERVKLTDAEIGGRCTKHMTELAALISTKGTGEAVKLPLPQGVKRANFMASLRWGAKSRGYTAIFRSVNGCLLGWVEKAEAK